MFILGSSSHWRYQLLTQIGIAPDRIVGPDIDETPQPKEAPRIYVERIALEKLKAIEIPDAYILTADTTVAVGRRLLGKTDDINIAESYLKLLSGRAHRLYTSVCLQTPSQKVLKRTVMTRLTFKRLETDEIRQYLDSNEWKGAAGGYTIQGMASKFVKFIQGSYTNVVGLPLYEVNVMLKGSGYCG